MISEKRRLEIDKELKEIALQNGYELLEDYTDAKTKIKCRCFKYGHIFYRNSTDIKRSKGCLICFQEFHMEYVNKNLPCVWETHPHVAEMLLYPEEGYKYSHGSGKIFEFVCPICGNIIKKRMCEAVNNGIFCNQCSSSKSYPNRLMYQVLTKLGVDFIDEYSPQWANGKLYDFYFIKDGQQYIIEMDGEFHYRSVYKNVEDVKANDNYKNIMAKENGIIMIRINCNYGRISNRFSYIRNSIISSEFALLYDLSCVDFDECHKKAIISILRLIADLWNSGVRDLDSISNNIGISTKGIITPRIIEASQIGLIPESEEEIRSIIKINGINIAKEKSRQTKLNKLRQSILEIKDVSYESK